MAVVKADGYGHGAVTVARAAVAAGAGWLGTTSVAGASALRAEGLAVPILTWLHPSGIDADVAAATRVDVAVGSVDELGALVAHAASTVRVRLHVDTGMSRGGCPRGQWDELIGLAQRGQQARRLCVVGVMGHLPLADRADPVATRRRLPARGAAGGLCGGARFPACPSCGHVGDGDRPGDTRRHGPRRGGSGRHRSPRDRGDARRVPSDRTDRAHDGGRGRHAGWVRRHACHRSCHPSERPPCRVRRRGPARALAPGRRRDLRAPLPGRRTGLDGPDRDRHRCRVPSSTTSTPCRE